MKTKQIMTDKEILIKAIEKAIKNGYPKYQGWVYIQRVELDYPYWSPYVFLFSHDFAKAFWGVETEELYICPKCGYFKNYSKHDEQLYCPNDGRKLREEKGVPWEQTWKRNLQEMVLEEEPLKYLERFL